MKQRKQKGGFLCPLPSKQKHHQEKNMMKRWRMGHPGWMLAVVLICGFRDGSCDLSLTVNKVVEGIKGESVVIPCTYKVSGGVNVEKIFWEFKGQSVIKRLDSEDHIQLVKYRNRAELSKSSGDASLTLKKLDIDDRGDFKCKVTGRDNSGKTFDKEGVTILKVLRKRPVTEKPAIPTTRAEATTERPVTDKPTIPTVHAEATTKIVVSTTGGEYVTTSKQHDEGILTTANSPDVTGASSDGGDSAIVNTKWPRKSDASTASVNPLPADSVHNDPVTDAMKGSGIFFYVLIIVLLCVAFIVILTTVLLVRRKRRKSFQYFIPTMNELAMNLEGRPCAGGGCQPNNYEDTLPAGEPSGASSCSNNYELTFPVSEYSNLPATSNEYEQLILKNPTDNDDHVTPS